MYHSRPARRVRAYRPRLEVLEDRTLLSTYLVDHLADDMVGSGTSGSLRYCITNATDGDGIQFGVTGTINLTGALPDLTRSVSIEGPGPDQLTVRRDTGGSYRIFTVGSGTAVVLSGLTITNGAGSLVGGGISNRGTLTLNNSTVSDNRASSGGGIHNFNSGTLTLTNSTLSGNLVSGSGRGGGISNSGTVTLASSTLSGNGATDSTGGGIRNAGTLTVISSTLSGNFAFKDGGGINNTGTLILTSSTLSYNSVEFDGGGGIYISSGMVTLTSSTLSGNIADESGRGGGIYISSGTLSLTSSTLSGNIGSNAGGGIYKVGGTVITRNTIIAGNSAYYGPDLYGGLGSSGYNLIGNTQGGSGFAPTDLLNVNPLLGPLQNNGGPTLTMALLPGSPAIDAGDNTDAPDWDQRGEGFPRIVNGIIDIGAFEVQADRAAPSVLRSFDALLSVPAVASQSVAGSPQQVPQPAPTPAEGNATDRVFVEYQRVLRPGRGSGVYNLGTLLYDALTVITHNHASTSNDDCFGC